MTIEDVMCSVTLDKWADTKAAIEQYAAEQVAAAMAWQPIETAPRGAFLLVYEDGAIRALFRNINGGWEKPCYPAIIGPWGDAIVGRDAQRILPAGYRLEVRDGCCETPTHWMPLPSVAALSAQEEA